MNISIIADSLVNDDKSGHLGSVSLVEPITTMTELGEIITNFHFCPGCFKENIRRKDHLETIQLISFDFDDGTSWEKVHERIKGYRHVIAGSKNHLKDKGDGRGILQRFHLFMPMDDPLTNASVYGVAMKWQIGRFGFTSADKQATDATRYFYRHSQILSVKDDGGQISKAGCLSAWDMYQINLRKNKLPAHQIPFNRTDRIPIDHFKRTKYFKQLESGALSTDGSRQENARRILGAMKLCGMSCDETFGLCCDHSVWGNSYTSNRLLDFANWIYGK